MGLFLAVVSVLSFLSDRNSLLGIIAAAFRLPQIRLRRIVFSAMDARHHNICRSVDDLRACHLLLPRLRRPRLFLPHRNCDDGNHERPSGDGRNLQDFQSDGRRRTAAVKHRILHTNDDAHNFQRLAADDCPHPAREAAVQRLQQKKLPITIYPPIIRL